MKQVQLLLSLVWRSYHQMLLTANMIKIAQCSLPKYATGPQ